MGIPTVYRSDDDSAPTLSGTTGALIALLKAVLVDGYGAQSPLGWTLEFEDGIGEVAVFRANSGARQYYRFQHNASSGSSAQRQAKVDVYETMSDENTGSANWHSGWVTASDSLSSDARGWVVVGDEAGFYLWVYAYGSAVTNWGLYTLMHYFGDILPADPTDVNIGAMSVNQSDNYVYNASQNRFCRAYSYANGASLVAHKDLAGTSQTGLTPLGTMGTDTGNVLSVSKYAPQGTERLFTQPAFYDDNRAFKGFMPGLYVGSLENEHNNTIWDLYEDNYRLFCCNPETVASAGFIRVDQDWRA
jgi:hypothetical protein